MSANRRITRRAALRAAASTAFATPLVTNAKAFGANDRITAGIIGLGGPAGGGGDVERDNDAVAGALPRLVDGLDISPEMLAVAARKQVYRALAEADLGMTSLDWEDVIELQSVQILQVRSTESESATGKVLVKDGKVQVIGDETVVFEQSEVITITAGLPKEINFWSGELSASANFQSGNTDRKTFNGRVLLKRRTVEQRMVFDYIGNYDKTEGDETENNHRLSSDWDRFVTDRFFWTPIGAEYYKDKFQNIEHRLTYTVALGYEIIDNSTTEWRVSGGPGYTKTWFQDVPEGENDSQGSPAFQAKTRFDHELTDDIDIWCDYRALFTNKDTGRYLHRMETGIAYEIIDDFDIRATGDWDYIAEPAEEEDGKKPDESDTQLFFGIGYTF